MEHADEEDEAEVTDRTAGSVDLATDEPDPVPAKAPDAPSENSSGAVTVPADVGAGGATTVLPVGVEPEPLSVARSGDADEEPDSGAPEGSSPDPEAKSEAEPAAEPTTPPAPATTHDAGSDDAANDENDSSARELPTELVRVDDVPGASANSPTHKAESGSAGTNSLSSASKAEPEPTPVRVTRGTRLADRYRLEHRLSQTGRVQTWRAVDEKLRRAVGVHIVPAGGTHGRAVIAAARSAALMGDPRFVQVLDCAEQDGLIYVVKEWLPDADNLTRVFESAPLPPHEVYELGRSLAQAMSVAHRAGLSHLRLTPENVLRMHTGQYKIIGLAVEAALYGHDSTDAARDDTSAVGRMMYAALTRRWTDGPAYGLQPAPHTGGRLCAPGQIRAGVDDTLAALTMRALGHDVRHQTAFGTPGELSAAITAIKPMLPPEPDEVIGGPESDEYTAYTPNPTRTVYAAGGFSGGYGAGSGGTARSVPLPTPPPALGGRFGAAVKSAVAILIVLAIVLVTWQIAAHVKDGEQPREEPRESQGAGNPSVTPTAPAPPRAIKALAAKSIGIGGNTKNTEDAPLTIDGDTTTMWQSPMLVDGPEITYLRTGYGIVYDLGTPQAVRTVTVALGASGPRTRITLSAAPGADTMPTDASEFAKDMGSETTEGDSVEVKADAAVTTRFVLVTMTENPSLSAGTYKGYRVSVSGYQNAWREVTFTT